jgi:hypothetical protein
MKSIVLSMLLTLSTALTLAGESGKKKWRWTPPYKDDPAVIAKLKALGEGQAMILPIKVTGLKGVWAKNDWLKRGPFTRGYCTKMPYAADRKTAFYCGQDHNLPHFNDAWEFHLGSATWHCLSNPDGGYTGRYWRSMAVKVYGRNGKGLEPDEKKREMKRAQLKEWTLKNVRLKDGYLQTSVNGGPIFAWHTWDGLTYDPVSGRMSWAVLDEDKVMKSYLKKYCTITGADFEALQKKLKPGMGLWSFDPGTGKWSRSMGSAPHPRMRGMGGSLTYIPDQKKIIWYAAAFNVSPADCQMWIYDTVTRKWRDLKPKCDWGRKTSPKSEAQMAYSPRHKKMVAVIRKDTFVYDVVANSWSKVCTEKDQFATDYTTVFAYDSNADLFLLFNAPKGQWNKKRDLRAFDLKTGKWQTLAPKGAPVPKGNHKGFYDPEHNVFVLADRGPIWVYRHRKAAVRTSDKSDMSDSPKPVTRSPIRTPKQVCTGWFSSARNYKKVGMLADARRCLKNVIKTYPKTEWAARARHKLSRL